MVQLIIRDESSDDAAENSWFYKDISAPQVILLKWGSFVPWAWEIWDDERILGFGVIEELVSRLSFFGYTAHSSLINLISEDDGLALSFRDKLAQDTQKFRCLGTSDDRGFAQKFLCCRKYYLRKYIFSISGRPDRSNRWKMILARLSSCCSSGSLSQPERVIICGSNRIR